MSRAYKAIGINLKAMPMGESDRLVTILTREYGLLRAIAPGARKHKSRLAGRMGLFVINELLLAPGKSLDKVVQAETQRSFPALSTDLARLMASQYLAELVLCEAHSEQPQEALFDLLVGHLERLEQAPPSAIIAGLAQATFHLLALAGLAPEVFQCCITRQPLQPRLGDPTWRAGFSLTAGGAVLFSELGRLGQAPINPNRFRTAEAGRQAPLHTPISALELTLLQQLSRAELVFTEQSSLPSVSGVTMTSELWLRIERLLRHYAQYHFDRPIRSATLIDSCFASPAYAS